MDTECDELNQNGEKDHSKEKKTKEEAAEGGWGYVVCFGMMITFIAGIGPIYSSGLIYNDFMNDTHSTAKSLTTAHGVYGFMLAIGGIILNIMSKKISLKLGGLIGAGIFCFGSFLTTFITNVSQLPFTFGVLQGIGFGIMVPVSYSTLNFYFTRKRTTVMSTCKAIQGFLFIWYPQLVKKIMMQYGFRGSLLIISALSLHTIPGMIVMTKYNDKTRNTAANQKESRRNVKESMVLLNHNENPATDKKRSKFEKAKFILEEVLCLKVLKAPTYLNICLGQSFVNLSDNTFFILQSMLFILEEFLCLKVLKAPTYLNICLGQSFVNFSDNTFFILQSMLLLQYGYDQTEVAACISIGAGADVAGRGALALISSIIPIDTRAIFFIGTLLTLIMRIVMFQVRSFIWMSTVTAMLGFLRAWLHVASPLVISSHVSHEDFPGAYALYLLAAGMVNMTLSPLIGQLKDSYQDYIPAFYALCVCCLPCLICWPIEYLWKKKKNNIANEVV